jgi:hypothetical protein
LWTLFARATKLERDFKMKIQKQYRICFIFLGFELLVAPGNLDSWQVRDATNEISSALSSLESENWESRQVAYKKILDYFEVHPYDVWSLSNKEIDSFAGGVAPHFDTIEGLLHSSDMRAVECMLEIHSRLGKNRAPIKNINSIKEICNDFQNFTPKLRQDAFFAFCKIAPDGESVFSQLLDIGLTFDLYNAEAIMMHNNENMKDQNIASKYFGLIQTSEYVYQEALANTGHALSEVNFLGQQIDVSNHKIVKVFCLLLMSRIGNNAIDESDLVAKGIHDPDEEIRFFTALALIRIRGSRGNIDQIIQSAHLSELNEAELAEVVTGLEMVDGSRGVK